MPIPNHCIDCDKVAVVLNITVPYCVKCYSKKGLQKPTRRVGHLSKRKMKS